MATLFLACEPVQSCKRKYAAAEMLPPIPQPSCPLTRTLRTASDPPLTHLTGRNGCLAKEVWDVCEVEHDAGLRAYLWRSLRRQPEYLFCRQEGDASSDAVTISRGPDDRKRNLKTEEQQVHELISSRLPHRWIGSFL